MKATREQIEKVRELILKPNIKEMESRYRESGLSPMRFRWDCLWSFVGREYISELYHSGLNDTHIDSILKKVFREHFMPWAAQ